MKRSAALAFGLGAWLSIALGAPAHAAPG